MILWSNHRWRGQSNAINEAARSLRRGRTYANGGGAVHGKMKNREKVGKMNILFQIKVQMDQNQPKLMNFYDLNAI